MSIKHIISEIKNHFDNKPIKVAELGILHGESIPILLNNLNVKEYYGIDLFDCYEENKDGSHELMKNHGTQIFNKLMDSYKTDERVNIIKDYTNKAVSQFNDNFFDLIFIDAGHEYEQVSEDIKLWYPKMKTHGIFSGDDFFHPPVQKAVVEFNNIYNLKLYNSVERNINAEIELPHYYTNYSAYWSWYFKT
jgi:hypothetical protein